MNSFVPEMVVNGPKQSISCELMYRVWSFPTIEAGKWIDAEMAPTKARPVSAGDALLIPIETAFHFPYEGDGAYYIALDKFNEKLEVEIPIQL